MSDKKIKNLVLTGASRGIGHATVKRFSSAGWRVITCSRQEVPENCPWSAGMHDHVQIDLSSMDDILEGASKIIEKLEGNPLHALVNNAGISPKNDDNQRLDTINTSLDCWQQVFQVNFFAPILLAKTLKSSLEDASGSIVNVTSIAGSRVHEFAGSAYATSKAALSAGISLNCLLTSSIIAIAALPTAFIESAEKTKGNIPPISKPAIISG